MAVPTTYKVGDFVYFESQPNHPYLVRRIEELVKTPGGNVEAKVACYFRKRDISSALLTLSEKHARDLEEEMGVEVSENERHLLNHKELFLSRQIDTLPATHIRGKCNVTLLNETEDLKSYLSKSDSFYYTLVYDPAQKTLVADRGEIRVGSKYQAEVPEKLVTKSVEEEYKSKNYETLSWIPNKIKDDQIDSFVMVAKSVGTYARALDSTGSIQPSVHINAACASRDSTMIKALELMHNCNYDFVSATQSLTNSTNGPMLCRDELEHWSPSEASLFEEAIEKFGKAFHEMQHEYFSWKTVPGIVEYYYMYKTSDRYITSRRSKAAEAENKLKQVYIPPYKATTSQMKAINGDHGTKACEGCNCTSSYQWYNWGPLQVGSRLCSSCWNYWKKYGGLKLAQSSSGRRETSIPCHNKPNGDKRNDSPYDYESMMDDSYTGGQAGVGGRVAPKTKQAFFLNTTKLTRISRRLCNDMLNARRHSRKPFLLIPFAAIKAECQVRLSTNHPAAQPSFKFGKKKWPKVNVVLERISGRPTAPYVKGSRPAKMTVDGAEKNNHNHVVPSGSSIAGSVGKGLKRPFLNGGVTSTVNSSGSNGGLGNNNVARSLNGPPRKRRNVNFPEMSEDYLFKSTNTIRTIRRQIPATNQRSIARRPNRNVQMTQPAAQALLQAAASASSTSNSNNAAAATTTANIVANDAVAPPYVIDPAVVQSAARAVVRPVVEPIVIDD